MEQIWVMHQPHQRTAFDQTCTLIGDHRWVLDQARVGQRFPMFLPGLGLAIVYQLDLQNSLVVRASIMGSATWSK